jgi:hypothetical protein
MAHRADGMNDIFENNVLIRETCNAKNFTGNTYTAKQIIIADTSTSELTQINLKNNIGTGNTRNNLIAIKADIQGYNLGRIVFGMYSDYTASDQDGLMQFYVNYGNDNDTLVMSLNGNTGIDFNYFNVTTTGDFVTTGYLRGGALQVDNININGAVIMSNTGAISFSNENLTTTGWMKAASYYAGASSGATGTFTTVDGKTVTVTGGIITSIV